MTDLSTMAVARAEILIRRPVEEVFAAFVEPATLTKYWLAAASKPLDLGETVRWDFMVPGAFVDCEVVLFQPPRALEIKWSDGTTVVWTFRASAEGTVVHVQHEGFTGGTEAIATAMVESTQGFTIVLCDLKTLLESGKSANLVRDKALLVAAGMAKAAGG